MSAINLNTKFKEKFLFCYSILLVVLLLASANLNDSILLWILIVCSVLLTKNPIYLLPVYIISSLSTNYFIVGDGLGISRLIGFILIFGGVLHQIKNRSPFNKKHVIIIAIIFVYTFFSSALSLTGALIPFITMAQNLIVILFLSQLRKVNLDTLSKLLAISSAITILMFAFTLKDNLIVIQAERLTTGDNVNVNRFAMTIAQLTAIIFASFIIFKQKKMTQILLLTIVLLAYFMLILSGSRSGTIGISGAIFLVIFYSLLKQPKKFLIPFILILCAGYFLIIEVGQLDIPFINRFTVEDVRQSGGTNRFEVWEKLIPVTFENSPIFGYGLGGENSYALANLNGLNHAAHNFVIDMFIQTGLLGISLFFYYFFFAAKKLKSSLQDPYMYIPIMILLTALFNGIGETVYLEKFFWNGIALSFIYVNNTSNPVNNPTALSRS